MLARFPRSLRVSALATLSALLVAACGEPAAPPAKSAGDAPPAASAAGNSTPDDSAPAGDSAPGDSAPAGAAAPAPMAAANPAVDGYVFKKKMPAVGARVTETETKTLDLTIQASGKKPGAKAVQLVRGNRGTVEKTVEVLAAGADAITKVKVTYKDHSEVESEGGKDKKTTSPVTGKTYVVEAKGGAVTVLTDKGAPAPADEAAVVQKDFKRLGQPDAMQKALPDTPIQVGDKVDSLAQGLRDRIAQDDDGKTKTTVDNVVVTLASAGDEGGVKTGVFDISLDLTVDKGGLVIRMKMGGEVKVRMDDGFPLSMSLKAPVTVQSAAGAPGPKITGSGLSTMSSTRREL